MYWCEYDTQVLYLDGEEETLNLEDEIWEIIQEYSVQYEVSSMLTNVRYSFSLILFVFADANLLTGESP